VSREVGFSFYSLSYGSLLSQGNSRNKNIRLNVKHCVACNKTLEFHHLDPNEKDYSYLKTSFTDTLNSELDKCVLLCANCHREEHHLPTTDI